MRALPDGAQRLLLYLERQLWYKCMFTHDRFAIGEVFSVLLKTSDHQP